MGYRSVGKTCRKSFQQFVAGNIGMAEKNPMQSKEMVFKNLMEILKTRTFDFYNK